MQKIFNKILSLCLAAAVCVGLAAFYNAAEPTVVDAATTTASASSYYSGITATGGTALLGQLHDLITTSRTKYSTYDECHTKGATTDPGSASNTVMEFYTQIDISYSKWDVSGGWNREHVWAKSDSNGLWETSGGGSDLHHIRPAEKDLNNHRGNMKYGEVTNGKAQYTSVSNVLGGYSTGSSSSGTFEPLDNVKGDVARILMYVYTHYNTYSNVNGTTNGSGNSSYFGTLNYTLIITASNEAAAKQLLLKWNKLDPVDDIERARNEEVYKIQGNRNPFIDNETYADAIWGNGTAVDPDPGPQPSDTLQSISMNPTAITLSANQTYNLTVTPKPSTASASVKWTSSDEAVATVSNGTVTAKAAGTATITATSTSNSAIKATATVTVLQSSSSETPTDKATITLESFGSNPTPSAYKFYTWNAGSISGTAYIYSDGSCMQFNTSKSSYYLASTTATSSPIKSVKVTAYKDSADWKLLTSNTAFGEVSGAPAAPENGNDRGTKTVTTDGATWTIDGSDAYFALVREGKGAAYLDSIEVEYGSGGSSENPPELQAIAINPTAFSLKPGGSTKLSVISVPSNVNADVNWTSSNPSVAKVNADGTVTAVAEGTATITATSKSNSEVKANATVTVTMSAGAGIGDITFHDAVAAINSGGTLAEWYNSINTAVVLYGELSEADKLTSVDEIVTLSVAITSYNEAIKTHNEAADSADETALKGAGRFH